MPCFPEFNMQAPDLTFGFVNDTGVLLVLDEYYRQAQKAAAGDSYLGVIVGCGSVLEGLLTWALLQRREEALMSGKAPKDKQEQVLPIPQWGLAQLIDVSVELGAIGKTAKQASWALKDFRNFLHPYNVLQQSARPDQALAMSALAALAEIRRSLEGHLPK
jgi:hypothetical protein